MAACNIVRDMLSFEPGIDGVAIANTLMTMGVPKVLREHDRSAPTDVAAIRIDIPSWANLTAVAMATLGQSKQRLTTRALALLIARIERRRVTARYNMVLISAQHSGELWQRT